MHSNKDNSKDYNNNLSSQGSKDNKDEEYNTSKDEHNSSKDKYNNSKNNKDKKDKEDILVVSTNYSKHSD